MDIKNIIKVINHMNRVIDSEDFNLTYLTNDCYEVILCNEYNLWDDGDNNFKYNIFDIIDTISNLQVYIEDYNHNGEEDCDIQDELDEIKHLTYLSTLTEIDLFEYQLKQRYNEMVKKISKNYFTDVKMN